MEQTNLPNHPDAEKEFRRLQWTCDVIDCEITDLEALTGYFSRNCPRPRKRL